MSHDKFSEEIINYNLSHAKKANIFRTQTIKGKTKKKGKIKRNRQRFAQIYIYNVINKVLMIILLIRYAERDIQVNGGRKI